MKFNLMIHSHLLELLKKQYIFLPLLISVVLLSCNTGKKNHIYQPLEKSLLWEIQHKENKQVSYLFGTIHLIPSDDYFWTDAMEQAFSRSDEVVFEIDMAEMTDISKLFGLMQHLYMKGDTTLADLLTKNEYDKLSARFQQMGLPLFMFERMKPFFLTTFLSDEFSSENLQEGSLKSYEMELSSKAEGAGKRISGLETIEFQASVFDRIPYKEQAKMLIQALEGSDDDDEIDQMMQMVQHYKNQDIQKLGEMISSDEQSHEDFEEILLFERNKNWIGLMASKMKTGTTFFAVGAGHLPGEQGVIHLLRKEGYKLKPIR